MIKKMLFVTIALFTVFQVIAKTTPGKDTIDNEPLTWNIDIYEELKSLVPTIATREVFYIKLENHGYFGIKNKDFQSMDKTVGVSRGPSNKTNIKPEGQLAKPGDIIELSYNQKLQVYVPFVNKTFWISAAKGKRLKVLDDEIPAEQAAHYQKIREARKEIDFKPTTKSSKAREEAADSDGGAGKQ